jgi:tetratricopeptide (TPR) repeat protein
MLSICDGGASPTDVIEFAISTTSGIIALVNLQAQIGGLLRQAKAGGLQAVSDQAELIELVALRGQVLGHIDDYEWAEERAEQLTRDAPADGAAFVARAVARARFHRFADALADLDEAQRLGRDPIIVDAERAAIFQAIGNYEAAVAIYNEAVKRRRDFASVGALAVLHAERGEIDAAEQSFDESRNYYRGVSPFPLAQFDFQRGLMWFGQGDLDRALSWFKSAVRLLPAFAQAQGHMAEVEAALGDSEAAIARLLSLTVSSDDPDYAAQLAGIFGEIGRVQQAKEWRNKAAARYDELIALHAEAFADHAAEFWLDVGADPDRALGLAKMNLEVRPTPRAHQLFSRAILATKGASASAPTHNGDNCYGGTSQTPGLPC